MPKNVQRDKRKEMFQHLSDAITPKRQKILPKLTGTATCTDVTMTKTDNKENLNMNNNNNNDSDTPKFNLLNMELQKLDDYDTIDDELLANLIYDTDQNNEKPDEKQTQNQMAVTNSNQQINIKTVNNKSSNQYPPMPHMYFPKFYSKHPTTTSQNSKFTMFFF